MRHHGLSGTLGLTFSGCSWILFSIGYCLYDISTVLENAQGVNRSSNSKDSRHDPLLHCWLGMGSIRMTTDMTDHSTVGLGGGQFEWQQTWPITPLLAWEGLNSNDNRHDRSLHCWIGRGSIQMTTDMTNHSTVGLGEAHQYKLRSGKCIKHSRQMLILTCNWVSRIVVILNFIYNIFALHDI
jgi:hypothetical protein